MTDSPISSENQQGYDLSIMNDVTADLFHRLHHLHAASAAEVSADLSIMNVAMLLLPHDGPHHYQCAAPNAMDSIC